MSQIQDRPCSKQHEAAAFVPTSPQAGARCVTGATCVRVCVCKHFLDAVSGKTWQAGWAVKDPSGGLCKRRRQVWAAFQGAFEMRQS